MTNSGVILSLTNTTLPNMVIKSQFGVIQYKHWQWKTHLLSPPLSSRLSSPRTQTRPWWVRQTDQWNYRDSVCRKTTCLTSLVLGRRCLTPACIYIRSLGNLTTSHKVLLHLISESVLSSRCLQLRNSDEVELKTPTRERDTCHHIQLCGGLLPYVPIS